MECKQTELCLIDEWCSFLSEEKFNVGISIDGPGDLHNNYRKTAAKESTLHNVIRGYELLKEVWNNS